MALVALVSANSKSAFLGLSSAVVLSESCILSMGNNSQKLSLLPDVSPFTPLSKPI